MRTFTVAAAVLCLFLASCAVAPRTLEEMEAEKLSELLQVAKDTTSRGDAKNLTWALARALTIKTGAAKVRELFAATPAAKDLFVSHLALSAAPGGTSFAADVIGTKKILTDAASVLPAADISRLESSLEQTAARGNASGALRFTLLDYQAFPALSSEEQQRIVLANSFAQLAGNVDRRDMMAAVLQRAQQVGPTSEQGRLIEAAVAKVGARRSDLAMLTALYPELAEKMRQRLFVKAYLHIKGADRLTSDDIKAAMHERFKALEWVNEPDTSALGITVEKVRHEEKSSPERRETVTYAQHQVNIVYAVMLMPRNASYIYEISSSEAAIDYGYVVTVQGRGERPFEQVVRGTATSQTVRCSNARIQNVFGGVTSAEFVANDDMAQRCNSSGGRGLQELRSEVLTKVADALAGAPQVKPVIDAAD